MLAMMADSIEHVISYWLLYEKFHSPVLAGFAVLSHSTPFFFAVYFGALADRFDCRKVIQVAQIMYMSVPDFYRVRVKQYRPGRRHTHVHDLCDLNHFAAIEAIGESAEVNGEEQERRPVAEHGKAGQHRRMKFLVQQPIADHVLDAVRHHCQHSGNEIHAKILVAQRRKSDFRFGCCVGRPDSPYQLGLLMKSSNALESIWV